MRPGAHGRGHVGESPQSVACERMREITAGWDLAPAMRAVVTDAVVALLDEITAP